MLSRAEHGLSWIWGLTCSLQLLWCPSYLCKQFIDFWYFFSLPREDESSSEKPHFHCHPRVVLHKQLLLHSLSSLEDSFLCLTFAKVPGPDEVCFQNKRMKQHQRRAEISAQGEAVVEKIKTTKSLLKDASNPFHQQKPPTSWCLEFQTDLWSLEQWDLKAWWFVQCIEWISLLTPVVRIWYFFKGKTKSKDWTSKQALSLVISWTKELT